MIILDFLSETLNNKGLSVSQTKIAEKEISSEY